MKRLTRAMLLAVIALGALAVAAPAFAAFTAKMSVAHGTMGLGATTATQIHIVLPQTNDPAARVAIYAPTGYTANLTQAAGTTIGTTTASAFSRDTNLTLPLSGSVTVDNPANHTSDPCSPGTNAAVWILNLSVAGQTIALPVYVNPTAGTETALGAYKIVTCLPPPDVPPGTPGRSVQGAQVLEATFTVNGIYTTPSTANTYAWEGIFTPYTPGKGTPNPLGTIEARALVPLPVRIVLGGTYSKKKNLYQLKGTLTAGGQGVTGTTVKLFRGLKLSSMKQVASLAVRSGAFKVSGHLKPKKTTYFQARVAVPESDATSAGCANPLPPTVAPGGCVSATLPAWTAQSVIIRIKL